MEEAKMNKQELIKEFKKIGIYNLNIFGSEIEGIPTKSAIALIEQLDEPQKVTIPQLVADWIEVAKSAYSLYGAMTYGGPGVNKWLENEDNQRTFALAWFDGYDIQETKYVVTDGNHLYFKGYQEDIDIVILADEQPGTIEYVEKFDTREEAQEVADVLGWKVQEVE